MWGRIFIPFQITWDHSSIWWGLCCSVLRFYVVFVYYCIVCWFFSFLANALSVGCFFYWMSLWYLSFLFFSFFFIVVLFTKNIPFHPISRIWSATFLYNMLGSNSLDTHTNLWLLNKLSIRRSNLLLWSYMEQKCSHGKI